MIQVQGLCKRFGPTVAVDHLSFSLERGDAFGFIGPNGAGKTTTIRMLSTLLLPDAGTATINGCDIRRDPVGVRASLGYMPDFFGVYDDMKVWEYLDFFAAAYRVPFAKRPGLISDVLELTDMGPKRDQYVDTLSRGQKQRLCLAKTLVHDPEVLLLDEPASGLDPRARVEIRELLQELCKMDKTLLISSHILPELSDLCNKIGIIENGRLVMAGDVREIGRQVQGGTRLHLRVASDPERACFFLGTCPQVESPAIVDDHLTCIYRGPAGAEHELLTALVQQGFSVQSFTTEQMDLEDLYMGVTGGGGE